MTAPASPRTRRPGSPHGVARTCRWNSMSGRSTRDAEGFTLIELMVVVLIIAILLAIAIPTYLGARDRANDRRTQSNLRTAHTNELVWFADNNAVPFTSTVSDLRGLDVAIDWTDQFADLEGRPGSV